MFITHQTTFNNSLILHTQSRYVVNTDVALSPFRKRSITFASQMNRFNSLISSETGGVHHSYPLQHCVVQTEMSCLPTQTLKKKTKKPHWDVFSGSDSLSCIYVLLQLHFISNVPVALLLFCLLVWWCCCPNGCRFDPQSSEWYRYCTKLSTVVVACEVNTGFPPLWRCLKYCNVIFTPLLLHPIFSVTLRFVLYSPLT